MQICQCDLTCNLVLDSQEYVDVYLRILKNPTGTPKYRVDIFKCNEKKPKNPQQANQHSHCIRCKQASFPSYDKIDQLKMIGRCPDELEDAAILWLEAQLSRPALKRALGILKFLSVIAAIAFIIASCYSFVQQSESSGKWAVLFVAIISTIEGIMPFFSKDNFFIKQYKRHLQKEKLQALDTRKEHYLSLLEK